MSPQFDTGYIQTGARVVEENNLYPGCSRGSATFDGNLISEICLNTSHLVLEFNPTGSFNFEELWVKAYGACGTLAHGYGQLIFSLYDWSTRQFQEVKTYNEAVPEIWHWMEFKVVDNLPNLVKPDGTIRMKIESPFHIGTSARVVEVYVRAVSGELTSVEALPVSVIDGIGPKYARQLNDAEVMNVEELYMIYPITFCSQVELSVARLYEFQKKADVAINTKFPRDVYESVFDRTLIDIIETPDDTLMESAELSQDQILELKDGIATLFMALDNSAVKDMTLSQFEA
jgi:hypothetical protein